MLVTKKIFRLGLCLSASLSVWFNAAQAIAIEAEALPPHPRLLWQHADLELMRERVQEEQFPHVLVWQHLHEQLQSPMAPAPESSEQTMVFYNALIAQGARARDLALAWWITGEKAYAQQALEFIRAWSVAQPTPGFILRRPNGEMETRSGMYIARSLFPMLTAADLLWDSYPDFDEELKLDFAHWLRQMEQRIHESIDTWEREDYFGGDCRLLSIISMVPRNNCSGRDIVSIQFGCVNQACRRSVFAKFLKVGASIVCSCVRKNFPKRIWNTILPISASSLLVFRCEIPYFIMSPPMDLHPCERSVRDLRIMVVMPLVLFTQLKVSGVPWAPGSAA